MKKTFLINGIINILITVLLVLFVGGMFLSQPAAFKIFSFIVFIAIFLGLRHARIELKPANLPPMWALMAADIALFSSLLDKWFLLSIVAIAIIYVYAPLIGRSLGLNDLKGVTDWYGTITDEGEIIGEDRYYECNNLFSLPLFIILFFYIVVAIGGLQ